MSDCQRDRGTYEVEDSGTVLLATSADDELFVGRCDEQAC